MPTLMAATKSRKGTRGQSSGLDQFFQRQPKATKAPVMDAVRVPPSA